MSNMGISNTLTLINGKGNTSSTIIVFYNKEASADIIHSVRKQYKSRLCVFHFDKNTKLGAFKGASLAEIEVKLSVNPSYHSNNILAVT